jgi:hypothetical protein
MAASYWPTGYWLDGYWIAGYWIGGGITPPTPTNATRGGGRRPRPQGLPRYANMTVLATMGPHRRREPWTWQEKKPKRRTRRRL